MAGKIFLIVDGAEEHRLSDMPPTDLTDYRQIGGPYAGMIPSL